MRISAMAMTGENSVPNGNHGRCRTLKTGSPFLGMISTETFLLAFSHVDQFQLHPGESATRIRKHSPDRIRAMRAHLRGVAV